MTFTMEEISDFLINANIPDTVHLQLSNNLIDLVKKKKRDQKRLDRKIKKDIKKAKCDYYHKNKQKYRDYYKKNRETILAKQKIIDKNRR